MELAVEARWRLDHALPVASTKTTVGEYLAYWLEVTRRRVRVSTYEAYALAAKRLDPSIGGERLSRLDPPKVQPGFTDEVGAGRT